MIESQKKSHKVTLFTSCLGSLLIWLVFSGVKFKLPNCPLWGVWKDFFQPEGVPFWCLSSLFITLFLTKLLELLQQIQVKTPWPWPSGWKLPFFLRHISWKQTQPWSPRGFGRQQAPKHHQQNQPLKTGEVGKSPPPPHRPINTGHLYDKLIYSKPHLESNTHRIHGTIVYFPYIYHWNQPFM